MLIKISFIQQGTTGLPKGATLTHHNILNNSRLVGQNLQYDINVCIHCIIRCFSRYNNIICSIIAQYRIGYFILHNYLKYSDYNYYLEYFVKILN